MSEYFNKGSITTLKRNIGLEIGRIDQKIAYITKLKDEAVENLLRQRDECHEKEIIGEIDEEIEHLKERHLSVIARQTRIHKAKTEYFELEEALAEINTELVAIQERHETVMQQLTNKRNFLQERLGSIQTLDEMKVQIDVELEKEIDKFSKDQYNLKKERNDLLNRTDLSSSAMELALRELDNQNEELERDHIRTMSQLTQASKDLSAQFSKGFSPNRRDDILQELDKLRQQALSATPSELLLIEARIEELTKELGQLDAIIEIQQGSTHAKLSEILEERGLKLTSSGRIQTGSGNIVSIQEAEELGMIEGEELSSIQDREKIFTILEQRGLTLTPSGRIRTEDGEVYSMEEARKLGLLQGLEDELMKMRGLTLTASGRILTKDGQLLTRAEAERLGLLDGINLDDLYVAESESESITATTATSMSGMSSSDVHYLKTMLGKPLALALAEITAKQPRDPIHYLGHWLYKYRYNQEIEELKKKELADLLAERERLAKEALRQQAEADVKEVLQELLGLVDEEAERGAMELELKRMEEDAAAIETEEAELEDEARDTLGVYDGPTRGRLI